MSSNAVRDILGEPTRAYDFQSETSETLWIYSGRYADGIDFSGQLYLGFLTLGLFWFFPPPKSYHEVVFKNDALVLAVERALPYRGGQPIPRFHTRVTSEPPGADVFLDNERVGRTPLKLVWKGFVYADRAFHDGRHTLRAVWQDSTAPPQVFELGRDDSARSPRPIGDVFSALAWPAIPETLHFGLR